MITEVAIFMAAAGKEDELGAGIRRGLTIIHQQAGCISATVTRCIEQPERYMLRVEWVSLEAHTVDFRSGPLFPQWRSNIAGLFAGTPEVFHYQTL